MPNQNWIIRDWQPEDIPAITAIWNYYIEREGYCYISEPFSHEDVRRHLQGYGARECMLVLVVQDHVVGWGNIERYSNRHGYRCTCETSVYLSPDAVGQGLGPRLKQALIQRCKDLKYHHLVAKICAENQASIRYNQKLGYRIVGTQKEVGYTGGAWRDVVIMELILKDVAPYLPELR